MDCSTRPEFGVHGAGMVFGRHGLSSSLGRARERARRAVEEAGGRVIGSYVTQGRYDVVLITAFPSEEKATATRLAMGMAGNLRTETLRAFTAEEMDQIYQAMP